MTQDQALSILKTGVNVFLTGEPGSGKTHTINQYVAYLREHDIEPAITASTGIAATHIGGMTIHSWSGIGIKSELTSRDLEFIAKTKYITKRIEKAKVLIIDEVSMLDGKIFSMADAVCRKVLGVDRPFGGLQVVLVGDFFQLPPIARNGQNAQFAFQSEAWKEVNPVVCYLSEQHRQDDAELISILSAIRSDSLDNEHICQLEARIEASRDIPSDITKLYSHNANVDRVNSEALDRLSGKSVVFSMTAKGRDVIVASIKKSCLSPEELRLKEGAVVMFTKNSPQGKFVNGTLGRVESFCKETGHPIVRTHDGYMIRATPMEWIVEENGKVLARIEQVPLRLAWAITIHKSQGTSLDAAVIDLTNAFEFGQGYVALSRVRRFSGIYLLGYNERALCVHPNMLVCDQIFHEQSDEATVNLMETSDEELKKKQEGFIIACEGSLEKVAPQKTQRKKARISTYDETYALFKEGKNIADIAKERGFTTGTVLSHFENLAMKDKISRDELLRLLSPELADALPDILDAFRESGTDKLTPVFEKFEGKYPYDDLRLARMMME